MNVLERILLLKKILKEAVKLATWQEDIFTDLHTHKADASAHHAKYTDAEALAAAKAGAGVEEGDLVQLDAVGLPAVDGSQLTGLPPGYTDAEAQATVKANVEVGDLKPPTKVLNMNSQNITG
ncbi:unnamed protein product, partial [marine sediment metagenome]